MKPSGETETALAFFFIAVAYKTPWTAISSLLGQLADQHGPRVLLLLNLAYFMPPMFLLWAMSALQGPLESALGVRRWAMLRLGAGLGGLSLLSLAFPAAAESDGTGGLLAVTAAIGAGYAVAFGTSYQLAPHFGPSCTVALTAGFVSAGCVVLILDLLIKRGTPHYSPSQLTLLFWAVAAVCGAGLAAAAVLLRRHARRLDTLGRAAFAAGTGSGSGGGKEVLLFAVVPPECPESASSTAGALSALRRHPPQHHQQPSDQYHRPHSGRIQSYTDNHQQLQHQAGPGACITSADVEAAAIAGRQSCGGGGGGTATKQRPCWLPVGGRRSDHRGSQDEWWLAAAAVAPAALALLASVGTSMLAFPFFSYIRTDGRLGPWMAQAAFYARLAGDICGRLVPHRWQARTLPRLIVSACLKVALLPVLLPALLRPSVVGGDVALVLLVAVTWVLAGYINTGAYLVAPRLAPQHRARVGGIMALAFQVSCFLGLMAATALQHLMSGAMPAAHGAAVAASSHATAAAVNAAADATLAAAGSGSASAATEAAAGAAAAAGLTQQI